MFKFKFNFHPNPKKIERLIIVGEIILPLFLAIVCQRLSIGRNFDFNLNVLFLNYILWLAVFLFFISLFKSHRIGLDLYIPFFFAFTITNRYRIKFLDDPLRINDIHLANQLPHIVPLIINYANLKKELFLSLALLIIVFILINKIVKVKFTKKWPRVVMLVISIMILTLPYFNKNLFDKVMSWNKIVFNPWYRLENCQNDGMLLCYVDDLQFIKNPVPTNYNQSKIEAIMKQASSSATLTTTQNQVKPNIILILSESLWDATKLPAVKLNPDPLANIRQDIKGNFISPTYGGGTANVEFEILTGLSNYLFDQESFPYTDLITKDMPSLFTVFNDNQYSTTVVHPYTPLFYNRNNVYKHFGLEKFTSLDQMSNPQMAGPFVSDKYFVDQILTQFNSTTQPQFIFGISMQNHDVYEPNRYPNKQIKVTGNLSQAAQDTLQTYTDGVNLTDQDYKYLKDELTKEKDKPTIVIMFGDHLPFLGDNYDVYQEGKLISNDENNWTEKDEINMHTTPLTIWSNYQVKLPQLDNISPEILSNEILNLANIQPEYQFQFTDQIKQKIPVLTKKVHSDVSQDQSLIEDYKLVQYDLLFGKQYIKNMK